MRICSQPAAGVCRASNESMPHRTNNSPPGCWAPTPSTVSLYYHCIEFSSPLRLGDLSDTNNNKAHLQQAVGSTSHLEIDSRSTKRRECFWELQARREALQNNCGKGESPEFKHFQVAGEMRAQK